MEDKRNHKKYIWKILLICLLVIILSLLILFIIRLVLPRQIDDVSPSILCNKSLIEESDILMVIPIYNNRSIAENKSWCEEILSLNKTLGMHGVYHSYEEFNSLRDKEYVLRGKEEFKKCFGFYPEIFEAPQLALSLDNSDLLKNMGLSIEGYWFQLIHKIYHCQDTGKFSNHLNYIL